MILSKVLFFIWRSWLWVSILFGLTFFLIIFFWFTSARDDILTREPIPDEDEVKLREYVD